MEEPQLKRRDYETHLAPLEQELVAMARWVKATGQRVCILFEGRDAAGKGGAIGAISRRLNPRQCHVVALPAPTERERGQWSFQRYVPHLPARGEIVLFDRSWYNRAGVERVMGYAAPQEVEEFLAAAPVFEKMLVDDGMLLFKYWLTTDQRQQEQRLAERLADPLKRWKLSPVDLAARRLYHAYTEAREAMLRATHTPHAPWTLVDFNDQRRGRLTLIRDLLDRLPDTRVAEEDIVLPPLEEPPQRETFGVVKPLPGYPLP
ncbi:polyphosphate kinase 2 [Qipengyuania thermophila]|uniref:polyphosphate kinase 2 n=1 Tax=Qipengyuania thermophila TaxID=2509361 RepID=UPI0018F8B2BB|nr:polyphosphate kinase 2 [Qipengyuania thermophila]